MNRPDQPGATAAPGAFDISFVALVNVALRRWRLLVLLPLVAAITAGVAAYVFPRYTAESRFAPNQSGASISQLAGIAAEFGFSVPGSEDEASIDFYGQLLASREILTAVVQTEYHFETDPEDHDSLGGNYAALYDIQEDTPAQTLVASLNHLGDRVSVQKDAASGVVTLRTTASWPALAELLSQRLTDLVAEFNQEKRQSAASAERAFVAGRLEEARGELEQEEAAQMAFLQENRSLGDSPRLKFEADRLQSRVDLRRQVYTTLAQAYEQARIEEVRNTPVLTFIDRALGSSRADRKPLTSAILGGLVGGLLALVIMFGGEYLQGESTRNASDITEFRRLLADLTAPLRNRVRALVRRSPAELPPP